MITEIVKLGGQEYSVRYSFKNRIVLDSVYHLDGHTVTITDELESEILEILQK